ncbi:MAG TPA: PhoH family protein, partial [Fibrobacteres bacterium]|nr:PhoH family protein [Fibrobacterota bacterium]
NREFTTQAETPADAGRARDLLQKMTEAARSGQLLPEFYIDDLLATPRPGAGITEPSPTLEKPVLIDRFGHPVQAKTRGQARFIQVIKQYDLVFAAGPAGTGKTFLAVAMAVQALEKKLVDRIILCRPAVESGESLGFLPGMINEKIAPYMRPLHDALSIMLATEKLREHTDGNAIEIAPLAYMRGRTLGRSFIILDEAQNTTVSQMKMFLTRIGVGSKVILTGDESQVDLTGSQKSGFVHARKILAGIDGIGQIELGLEDVVRHKLVRDVIQAYERHGVRD